MRLAGVTQTPAVTFANAAALAGARTPGNSCGMAGDSAASHRRFGAPHSEDFAYNFAGRAHQSVLFGFDNLLYVVVFLCLSATQKRGRRVPASHSFVLVTYVHC